MKIHRPFVLAVSACVLASLSTPPFFYGATMGPLAVAPQVHATLQPFSLTNVRLLPGPFQHAQKLDHDYLLFLEPDRFLHNFRTNAGLEAKAPIYQGWESAGVAGQTFGHYLSALAMMYQSTGDQRLKKALDYGVDEIALCQDKNGDGYVSAIPGGRGMFNDVKAGHGDAVHRGWVPWYTMHKLFAGLRDAYLLTGNQKAKTCLIKLADWAIDTTANLDDKQWAIMLTQEHGGMNETLADVYAMTGQQKYLDLARHFSQKALLDPLSQKRDTLTGLHANTQIPKVIGFERIYQLTGDEKYGTAADFFWQTVVDNRTYVTGGNSDHEHFFDPARTNAHLSAETAENCNVYNMLKLTRALDEVQPSPKYMDYYERALFNQILSSQDPVKGGFNYLNTLKPGSFKVYSNPVSAFWCCVGTGLENHSKYGDTIYFHDERSLYVNLFIASEVTWPEKNITLRQETRFPDEETMTFTVAAEKPTAFALKIRHPSWTTGATLLINNQPETLASKPGEYETIDRTWADGDKVTWKTPMALHGEPLHDSPKQRALLYGPIVLAADLGREGLDQLPDYVDNQVIYSNTPTPEVPALVADVSWETNDWATHVTRHPGPDLSFEITGLARTLDGQSPAIHLIPFSRAHHMRYNVYWNTYTPAAWQDQRAAVEKAQAARRALAERTVDQFRPNEQQSEADHRFDGQNTFSGDAGDTKWRDARDGGFFSFDLKLPDHDAPASLVVTYWGSDGGNRDFQILVDGRAIASQKLQNEKPNEYFNVTYPIPAGLTHNKTKVTVRF